MDLARQCISYISSLSINQALNRLCGLEWYLTHSFTYHCSRASTNPASLKTDLMQLCNLRPWLEIVKQARADFQDYNLPLLFKWLYKVYYCEYFSL